MYKVIDEFHLNKSDVVILTLNEQMRGIIKNCCIDGKEYKVNFVHFRGDSVERMMDLMLRTIAINEPSGGNFVGKEVEFL